MFNKKYNKNSYKKFLQKILIDKQIKEEIIYIVTYFFEKGNITFDGNNLYGKINKENSDYYLEIKYEKNIFIYNYTDLKGVTNIIQTNLSNNNVKIIKEDQRKISFSKYKYEINQVVKVYNRDNNKLMYKSNLDFKYNSLNDKIISKNSNSFSNCFDLERYWYIENGFIISHYLSNSKKYSDNYITENYLICQGSRIATQNDALRYGVKPEVAFCPFDELDKNLFEDFITGKITIEELLERNIEKNKTKVK